MKKLLLLLLLGMALPVLADDVATTLTVHITDGSQVTFLLSERPKVSFSDGCLIITSSEADASYSLSDVSKFTFGEIEVDTDDDTDDEESTDDEEAYSTDSVATSLIVHTKDGSQVAFLLSERPKVSFSDGYLLITSSEADATYPLSDVLMFTFEEIESEATGLSLLPADETSFALEGGAIVVTGLKEGSTAKVYTIGGIMIHSEKVDGGTWTYSLSSLSSGVYIISINGKTFKIAKK